MPATHAMGHRPIPPLRPLLAVTGARGEPDTVPSKQAVDRLLSCMAGFYSDEGLARNTAEKIQRVHGLASNQLVLLRPQDSPSQQFARMAALWAGYWPAGRQSVPNGRLSLALLGGLVILLAGWAAVLWSQDPSLFSRALSLVWLGGLLGLGLVVAWFSQRQFIRPHVRRFESRVQQQLAKGHWALVVCKLPWAHQAGVLELLRVNSLRWCAVAEPTAKL